MTKERAGTASLAVTHTGITGISVSVPPPHRVDVQRLLALLYSHQVRHLFSQWVNTKTSRTLVGLGSAALAAAVALSSGGTG